MLLNQALSLVISPESLVLRLDILDARDHNRPEDCRAKLGLKAVVRPGAKAMHNIPGLVFGDDAFLAFSASVTIGSALCEDGRVSDLGGKCLAGSQQGCEGEKLEVVHVDLCWVGLWLWLGMEDNEWFEDGLRWLNCGFDVPFIYLRTVYNYGFLHGT